MAKAIENARSWLFSAIMLPMLVLVLGASVAYAAPMKRADNAAELRGEFALTNAPRFEVSKQQQQAVDRVIGQFATGYAGTLVLAAPGDPDLDTALFLSRYLREYSSIDDNRMGAYDFNFERILARVSGNPGMLDEPRLDWDIWRSFLLYESSWDGSDYYRSGDCMNILDSARDLLWIYLNHHGKTLISDSARRQWWIEHLTHRIEEPNGRHQRRWFLLLLCSFADESIALTQNSPVKTPKENRGADAKVPMRTPCIADPFLVTSKDTKPPPFADALRTMTRPLGLQFEVWGIEPSRTSPTRNLSVRLEQTKWPVDDSYIVGQESWSDEAQGPNEWGVHFYRSVGQRAAYMNVRIPAADRKDGVYFFVYKNRLHVWPKAQMDSGVLQMLHLAGLVSDTQWQRFQAQGFKVMVTTLTGP